MLAAAQLRQRGVQPPLWKTTAGNSLSVGRYISLSLQKEPENRPAGQPDATCQMIPKCFGSLKEKKKTVGEDYVQKKS